MSDQPKTTVCAILERYLQEEPDELSGEERDDNEPIDHNSDGCCCPVSRTAGEMSSPEVPGEDSSGTSNASSPSLRLPYDIRELVYKSLLVFVRIVIMDQSPGACGHCGKIQDSHKYDMLALFAVSRLVGEEARRIFYSKNTFEFQQSMSSIAFIIGIGREIASLMRHVYVWHTELRIKQSTDDSTDKSTDDSTDDSTDESTDESTDDSTIAAVYTATISIRPFTIPFGTRTRNIWNSSRRLYEFIIRTCTEHGSHAMGFLDNYPGPAMAFQRFADFPSMQRTMHSRNRLLISILLDESQNGAKGSNALARFDLFWRVVDPLTGDPLFEPYEISLASPLDDDNSSGSSMS